MKISTKGRYALRMMVDLAVYDQGRSISLKDVATRQDVSMKYMEQIVSQLTKAGYLYSVRGPQGGYRLSREPQAYTVGDILRVTEGSLAPLSCLGLDPSPCPRAEVCSTLWFWKELYARMTECVDGTTLADLANRERERLADCG